jgi:hypothetical protein
MVISGRGGQVAREVKIIMIIKNSIKHVGDTHTCFIRWLVYYVNEILELYLATAARGPEYAAPDANRTGPDPTR